MVSVVMAILSLAVAAGLLYKSFDSVLGGTYAGNFLRVVAAAAVYFMLVATLGPVVGAVYIAVQIFIMFPLPLYPLIS